MKFIIDIFFFLFKKNKIFLDKVFYFNLIRLKNDRDLLESFIKGSGNIFYNELEKYPSLFNGGYKHIDKAIELVNYFNLSESGVIVDVGADIGVVSLHFAKSLPATLIYAFEPIPDSFKLLKAATSKITTIHTVNKALGNDVKEIQIHIASRISSSSIFNIKKNLINEFWSTNLKEERIATVSMSKLDLEIPETTNVNILKMDVQGFEIEVLKGGTETLKRTSIVLVEMQNHDLYVGAPKYYEVDEFLRNSNFELYNMIPSIRQEEKIYEWDAIYVNKNVKR
jgi:FkbM family methyltransferase